MLNKNFLMVRADGRGFRFQDVKEKSVVCVGRKDNADIQSRWHAISNIQLNQSKKSR